MNEIFILKREVHYPDKSFRCTIDKDVFFFKNQKDVNKAYAHFCMHPVRGSELCSNWRVVYERRKRARGENMVYGFLIQREFDDNDYYWMVDEDLFIYPTKEERDRQFEIYSGMLRDLDVKLMKFKKEYGFNSIISN